MAPPRSCPSPATGESRARPTTRTTSPSTARRSRGSVRTRTSRVMVLPRNVCRTEGAPMGRIAARLNELGIELPEPSVPRANYVPWVRTGNQVWIAGQVPFDRGALRYVGKLGKNFTVEEGQACARLVVLNVLAHLARACDGDLDRVVRVIKLNGFVNCVPE